MASGVASLESAILVSTNKIVIDLLIKRDLVGLKKYNDCPILLFKDGLTEFTNIRQVILKS